MSARSAAGGTPSRDARVPVDGSRVTAAGTVQHVDGKVRLCSLGVPSPPIGRPPGYVAPACWAGVWVEGLGSASALAVRVTGTLRGDVLVVESHASVELDAAWSLGGPPEVPCDAPPGGWPEGGEPHDDRSPDGAALTRFLDAHPGLAAADRVMLLRPAPGRQVAVVVVRDDAEKAAAEDSLRPEFGTRVCVVIADEGVDIALRALHDPRLHDERLSISVGTRWNPGLRTRSVHARVVRVTELMVQAEAEYPSGTIVLLPFLRVLDD